MDTLQNNTAQIRIKGPAGFLFVDDGGSGDMPVIFVHSFGGSTAHWTTQLQYLRHSDSIQKRRAIAFDSRGHGQSESSSNNDFTMESAVNDIAAVADSLKIKQFVLVGHSMGGSAAIAFAGKYPDRVAGLMLVGTPGKTPAEQAKPIIASLESDAYEKVMEDYMKQLLTNAKPSVDTLVREGMKKISREASLSIIKAVFQFDPGPALRSYPGPKLIVITSRESQQPNSLSKQFPKIPRKIVEGTSHWIQLDKPEEFNRVLDEFLKTVDKK